MKVLVPLKEQEVYHYRNFVCFLTKYEDINHKAVTAGTLPEEASQPPQSEAVFRSLEGAHLAELLEKTSAGLRNPFIYMRNWVKQEIFELQALLQAIASQINVEKQRLATIERIRKKKETIEKMSTGKFTLKGLFKNAEEKANEVQIMIGQISKMEQDVYNY
jgi:hypothetical protein